MYHPFQLWPQRHADRVAALWKDSKDLFLPWDFIVPHVFFFSTGIVIGLTLLYSLLFRNFDILFQNTILKSFTPQQKRKLCYQMINLLANLCLGSAGLYCEWRNRQEEPSTALRYLTVEQTTLGYESVVYFSAGQIGYQVWAIPMGIFYMQEPLSMIVHHFTVIVCASMSGFLHAGFRYWTPFFYGLVELSSVPLAIMNAFKDHPTTLQQRYPYFYKCIRILFAATFLYIRIVMFVPRKYLFLRDQLLLWTSIRQRQDNEEGGAAYPYSSSSTILLYQCFMATVWLSAFFLLVLQTYWATLIIKGVVSTRKKTKHHGSSNGAVLTTSSKQFNAAIATHYTDSHLKKQL